MKAKRFFSYNEIIAVNGKRLTIREWAKRTGLTRQRIYRRIVYLKWTKEDAVTTPPRRTGSARFVANQRLIEFDGKVMNLSQWGKELGMSHVCVAKRLKRYPVHIALSRPKCNNTGKYITGENIPPPENKPKFSPDELKNGVTLKIANQRIRNGWTRKEAATVPPRAKGGMGRWGHSRGNVNRLKDLAALGIIV